MNDNDLEYEDETTVARTLTLEMDGESRRYQVTAVWEGGRYGLCFFCTTSGETVRVVEAFGIPAWPRLTPWQEQDEQVAMVAEAVRNGEPLEMVWDWLAERHPKLAERLLRSTWVKV